MREAQGLYAAPPPWDGSFILHDSRCLPRDHGTFHPVAVLPSPNRFLGEVFSSQIEE